MFRNYGMKGRAVVLIGFVAMAAAGVGLWRTDMLLSRGFGKALDGARPMLSFQPAANAGQAVTPVAGDEGYWLTRAQVEGPTPFSKPLALGDRITIAGRDGLQQVLEIVELETLGTTPARVAAETAHPRLLLVTCRAVGGTADSGGQAAVRFIVEAETIAPATRTSAKTL